MNLAGWAQKIFRPGVDGRTDIRLDYAVLIGLSLLLVVTGLGLRDPWPADEPRFALVVLDMAATHDWLIPRVGGDVYADKPPLFFWLMAVALQVLGSLRLAFLLPSMVGAIGSVVLIYDLARRLWGRETGLIAGVSLLLTVQFVWQARQAQIDATLCFWTTLSLYGLLRHLLIGPDWRWYAVGWAAAGFGVITKGVGFLPILILLPFAFLRAPDWAPRVAVRASAKWGMGPLAFLLAVGVWLVPMLLAARQDPALASYRDEILFHQTIGRYANAWHHREPVWFFFTNVIPWLWLPLTALLPWIVPHWLRALRQRDLRIALPLCWIIMVVVFFTCSTGKRGVYVLPAVPALALICAPYLHATAKHATAQRVLHGLTAALGGIFAVAAVYLLLRSGERADLLAEHGIDPLGPLILLAAGAVSICALTRPAHGFLSFAGVIAVGLMVTSFWISPAINQIRSGAAFVRKVEQIASPTSELGLFAFKEQYLLNMTRPVVHFGRARWREPEQEAADAARWLAAGDRQLVVNRWGRERCFARSVSRSLGVANREEWYLVSGEADPHCIARGDPGAVHHYARPGP